MKHLLSETSATVRLFDRTRGIFKYGIAVVQAVFIGLGASVATGQSEDSGIDDQGAQVLTRGPVHEAFAGIVAYNPVPGVIVEKAPPEAIEELPPENRPAGDNISWIPGYWGWDDERSDYLWISGTWRALPPGRQWTIGYWSATGQGHQWISGYWADSTVEETTYLPKPPATVEAGPNVEAPSRDHSWTPGSWVWKQERYAWRAGYWAEGRSDWDWVPANYVWTPRGYVFVDGYWDYSFVRRGVVYAPVYFKSGYYSRPGYSYSPVIAIGLGALMEHLFLRPNYHHYYFGDYYERRYRDNGYYSPYAYQSSRYGYDPIYSYRRWTHRQDKDWESSYEASYDYRRDNESARPPRTWADQKMLNLDTAESKEQRQLIATPLDQMAKQTDSPMQIQSVDSKERNKLVGMSREVSKTRDQRRTLETEGVNISSNKTDQEFKPTKVKRAESPIAGRSSDRFEAKEAPPKPQNSTIVDTGKEKSDRKPDTEKTRSETNKNRDQSVTETQKELRTPRADVDPTTQKQQPQTEQRTNKPTRQETQAQEPKAKESKRETRQEPQAKEQKRETRAQTRQPEANAQVKPQDESKPRESGKRNEETSKPPSRKKSDPDEENPEKPNGKARKDR